ncbi:tRNA epoxyqueuosine(34) reductase QueG [Singulisphaera sp. PoT]|uniref:tRNA epoxyqueuosine(34) reductase QueG n=1 Tax=Singulisphaera sp. PoT TaxID=3411797 RepID=UPI003BF5AD33
MGIAPAVTPGSYPHYVDWLEAGHAAGMHYLEARAEARRHPEHVLNGVRSVVIVSLVYGQPEATLPGPTQAKVARYARGADYHEVLWRRLEELLAWLRQEAPEVQGKAVADTAPLLERDFARMAGIGWVGKNTMLIDRRLGSFTLLGALLVDVDLEVDEPATKNYCGSCTRCLDACPTDAFVAPYQLDARKCISYWTIEHKGPIDESFAPHLNEWVFGCDICQDVCPWNRKAPHGREPELAPRQELTNPDLIAWLESDPRVFAQSIRRTALSRSKRTGLLRNAALILGNRRESKAVPALVALLSDQEPVIRCSIAWALGRIATPEAISALRAHENEKDPLVRGAIQRALVNSGSR